MKPRLDRAPLTPEDEAISERYRVGHGLLFLADTGAEIQGDRRDADLMLYAQQNKRYSWVRTEGDTTLILPGQHVHLRGAPALGEV